jgi:hypothetical protein
MSFTATENLSTSSTIDSLNLKFPIVSRMQKGENSSERKGDIVKNMGGGGGVAQVLPQNS